MKTKVLFAGILFLSGTAFAQDANTKNEASAKASATAKSTGKQAAISGGATSASSSHLKTDATKKAEGEAKPQPLFSRVGYTMNATGGFHQMLTFLHAVEHGPHFYHLKDFSLQRSAQAGSRDITITMNFDLLGTP